MSSWNEVSPGKWERPGAFAHEMANVLAGAATKHIGVDAFSLAAWSTFDYTPASTDDRRTLQDRLKHAWKWLGCDVPAVLTTLSEEGVARYASPQSADELNAWCDMTFVVVQDSDLDEEEIIFRGKFDPRMYCYFFPHASRPKILFYTSHWRVDGIGMTQLLHRFFGILARRPLHEGDPPTPWHVAPCRLMESLETAAGIPAETPPAAKEHVTRLLAEYDAAQPPVGLPYNDTAKQPGPTRHAHRTYTHASTTDLIAWCKILGVSVTSALQTALILAHAKFSPPHHKDRPYVSNSTVNVRPWLKPPYNADDCAAGNYFSQYNVIVADRAAPFEQIARGIAEEMKQQVTTDLVLGSRDHLTGVVAALMEPPPEMPSEVRLSSVGVVDRYCSTAHTGVAGTVRVRSLGLRPQFCIPNMFLTAVTFDGRLVLNLGYCTAYQGREQAVAFLDEMEKILERDMGCAVVVDQSEAR